jgi:hypothetical protein
LISFNAPGHPPLHLRRVKGDDCAVGRQPGKIKLVDPVVTEDKSHNSQTFAHRTIDYLCVTSTRQELKYRATEVQRNGSPFVFVSELAGVASDEDRLLAARILREVED